jgi:uncharacterized protein YndB with AHSA1/START domain
MKKITDQISIDVPAGQVWSVFTDVERWPQWTPSVKRVEIVVGNAVEVGAVVRMKQPRLPTMRWQVVDVVPGVSWRWVARSPGITTIAGHTLTATSPGSTLVEQSIEHRGPFAWLHGRATRRLTRRFLRLEAEGLKARCEASGPVDATEASGLAGVSEAA